MQQTIKDNPCGLCLHFPGELTRRLSVRETTARNLGLTTKLEDSPHGQRQRFQNHVSAC
jgi:hypothetical protein